MGVWISSWTLFAGRCWTVFNAFASKAWLSIEHYIDMPLIALAVRHRYWKQHCCQNQWSQFCLSHRLNGLGRGDFLQLPLHGNLLITCHLTDLVTVENIDMAFSHRILSSCIRMSAIVRAIALVVTSKYLASLSLDHRNLECWSFGSLSFLDLDSSSQLHLGTRVSCEVRDWHSKLRWSGDSETRYLDLTTRAIAFTIEEILI